jgi:tRNA(fMet)-specific endonuclease VapC
VISPLVLDTTAASLLQKNDPLLISHRTLIARSNLILSFQTVAEMRYGALVAGWGNRRRQGLDAFFLDFDILTYSDPLSHLWAEVMTDSRRVGRRLEAGDAWIAATARLLNAPLFTHDLDFSPEACPSITVLRVTG